MDPREHISLKKRRSMLYSSNLEPILENINYEHCAELLTVKLSFV